MVFKKARMIERVTKEGKAHLIDDDVLKEMDNLDGQEVIVSCWRRVVHGENVYWCIGKNGRGNYVNENDCEYKGAHMEHIKCKRIRFRYRDAMSNWEWREQSCIVSSLEECIRIYGLGIDCDYEIISIENVN